MKQTINDSTLILTIDDISKETTDASILALEVRHRGGPLHTQGVRSGEYRLNGTCQTRTEQHRIQDVHQLPHGG